MYIYESINKDGVEGYVAYRVKAKTWDSYLCRLSYCGSIFPGGVSNEVAKIIKNNFSEVKVFMKEDINNRNLFVLDNNEDSIEKTIRGIIRDELPDTGNNY